MRYSHQGFGTSVNNLNSSLMLPSSSQGIDMNVTQNLHTGSVGQIGNMTTSGPAQTKQWLNQSFDVSKSANQLNYTNSAYVSHNHLVSVSPQVTNVSGAQVPKISKVVMKNPGNNSRQAYVMQNNNTNYSDDTANQHLHFANIRDSQTGHATSQGFILNQTNPNFKQFLKGDSKQGQSALDGNLVHNFSTLQTSSEQKQPTRGVIGKGKQGIKVTKAGLNNSLEIPSKHLNST